MTDLERVTAALTDKYAIERELGHGEMATVYLARDRKHDRQVAITVVRPEIAAALGGDRFLREIEIAGRLQHPNILMMLDSGEADGLLYYVMPHVEGETLQSRLEREIQLPIDDALQIIREVASALGYANNQGIVHCDVTPDNIMLTGGHAVITDFGVRRLLTVAAVDEEPMTAASAYMSPEQASDEQSIDGRSDIYSLGCVLYHTLTGEPPYTGATPEAITAKRLSDPVPSVRRIRETVPLEVEAAIQKGLAKDPADRFATADEFAAALAPSRNSADASPQVRKVGSLTTALIAVAVVALVSLAVIMGIRSISPDDAASQPITLAVLPFENLGAPDDEYFAQGMTEELADRLTRLSGLSIIGPASSGHAATTDRSEGEIGEALDVEYLLAGTVRWAKAADGTSRVRVTPRLVRVSDEARVWSEPYDAYLTDVFELQADLAERVARAMDVTLLSTEQTAIRTAPTESGEAYQAYLLGRYHHARNEGAIAVEHYKRAIEIDPGYAMAYAGMADAYHHLLGGTDQGGLLEKKMDLWAKAEQAARRALALDSTLGAAYISLGYVQMSRDLDWERAEANLIRGLILDPDYAYGHSRLANLLTATGRLDSAVAEWQRAVDLEPLDPQFNRGLAPWLVAVGRTDEAFEAANRAVALDQLTGRPQWILASVYVSLKNWDAAAEQFTKGGLPPDLIGLWRAALSDSGNNTAFLAYLDRASALTEVASALVALLLVQVGENDRAIELLERAVADRTAISVNSVKAHPLWDPLRDKPRFQALLDSMGL